MPALLSAGPAAATTGLRRDGTARRDVLLGSTGDDTLLGYTDSDDLRGGDGDDLLVGGAGDDVIGWTGYRPVPAGEANPGEEAGNDTLLGGAGNDTLGGGDGNDLLLGAADRDLVRGGTGDDTLLGGEGNDSLFGDEGRDLLLGGSGADVLEGGADADTLTGGDGDDLGRGGAGADLLVGGAGRDTLHGDAGDDSGLGGTEGDAMFGGAGADTLSGGAGDDLLVGGVISGPGAPDVDPGADALYGGDGADTLIGGGGADRLGGGTGADLLRGGTGNDTLAGGTGDDTLTGGAGDDVFVLRPGDAATITDFRPSSRSVSLTFDELEPGTPIPEAYGGLAWGAVHDPDTGEFTGFNAVTVREGGSIRAPTGTLGISDPDGRAFVVEGGVVLKHSGTIGQVRTYRDGDLLQTFGFEYDAERVDLGLGLAGMLPADHIEIEDHAAFGGVILSVPLDSLSIRYVEAPEQDLLHVATPALAAGLVASAADVEGAVAMSFGGISVTLLGRAAAEASLDWFG
ncbi:calcium-binding protein [Neoroseomonas soli]|uniref:Calcium-binding protein n=1 Tax=Neoroseomonas soli TaxID=1081025 RepID=A0A9X9WWV3_9PROT|nr:calcium-binding protein [Neoroseomonas soli]MBR0671632.1 calcium-binding protein [Neoroseomonas soli]